MKKEKRFQTVKMESMGFASHAKVIVDRETGVQYLFVHDGYAGGLTPLLDAQGRPLVSRPGASYEA